MGRRRERSLHGRSPGGRATPPGWQALVAFLLLSGCGGGPGSPAVAPPAAGAAVRAELLFVVQATGASLSAPESGGRPILHLTGVAPSLLAFADRPLRIASARPTAALVEGWADYGFAADPPNGALSVGAATPGEPLALELRDPRYDAAGATLDFTVTSLLPDPAAALRALVANDGGCAVALFIDATQPVAPGAAPSTQDVSSLVDTLAGITGHTFTPEQQDLISSALADLLQVAAADSSRDDPQLLQSNVGSFIDDLQEVLGVSFSADDHRLLTGAIVHMIDGAVA